MARVSIVNQRGDLMRSIIYSFPIVGAALAFGGCAGGTPFAPSALPIAARAENSVHAASFGELFKASGIVVKKGTCIQGQSGNATFKANGTASGPHKGKFAATGQWSFFKVSGQNLWTFAETFKITGAHPADGTVTGNGMGNTATCTTFGPVSSLGALQYHLGMASGAATTNLMKNGSNLLQRLH
jgi:hypothetical protein